jgi:hypothetical protein
MKSVVVPAILALAFAVAGVVFWTLGRSEQRLADAHKELVMLRYADASNESSAAVAESPLVQRVAGLGQNAAADARHVKTTADYWESAYAALEPKRDAAGVIVESDPQVLLLATNASFRASQFETDRNAALRKLDAVVKNYGELLKTDGGDADAAYNYEYAVRLRDTMAKARPTPQMRAAVKTAAEEESDLPAGPTLHGHPGGPPAKSDMAQFKIVIPKRGEERKDDPQAGKGGTKVRKG